MTDPANRTYPTTITNIHTTTLTGPSATLTIDRITILDPWPISPDRESMPYTMTQTQLTTRVVSSPGATPSAIALTSTAVYNLWDILPFDMPPSQTPMCPSPERDCAYGSIKPNPRCEELGRETRCAAQCLLKDWLWWCPTGRSYGKPEAGPVLGRVCYGDEDGKGAALQLMEPCDHTDFLAGCPRCKEEEEWSG